jgi:hypothetical protein
MQMDSAPLPPQNHSLKTAATVVPPAPAATFRQLPHTPDAAAAACAFGSRDFSSAVNVGKVATALAPAHAAGAVPPCSALFLPGLAAISTLCVQATALCVVRLLQLRQFSTVLAAARTPGARSLVLSVLALCVSNRKTSPLLSKVAQLLAAAQADWEALGLPVNLAAMLERELTDLLASDEAGAAAGISFHLELVVLDGATAWKPE